MKVCVITSAKFEEIHIKEFVDHYIKLGVDTIIINDNNPKDYPYQLTNILEDYIKNRTVIIERYFDNHELKSKNDENELGRIYDWLYKKYTNQYDWFLKFDIDEYFTIPETNNNVKKFLSQSKFKKFHTINVFWQSYHSKPGYDISYINLPINDKFEKHTNIYAEGIKCIIRGGIKNIIINHHHVLDFSDLKELKNDEYINDKDKIAIHKGQNKRYIYKLSNQCLTTGESLYDLNLTFNCYGELVNTKTLETVKNNNEIFLNTLNCGYIKHYREESLEERIIRHTRLYKDVLKLMTAYYRISKRSKIRDLYKTYFLNKGLNIAQNIKR